MRSEKNGNRVYIFDTTLRDGQQCPGAGMSFERNLEYSRLASKLGIDVLEAGFPAASKLDFDIVRAIAEEHGKDANAPVIAALCQLRAEQIDRTIEALSPTLSGRPGRLHVYVPVDPALMEASLGARAEKKGEIANDVYEFILRATKAGLEVEFSPEGYSRMGENFAFTTDLIRAAVQAGALVINCPDTIGSACSVQGNEYFVQKMAHQAALIRKEFPDRSIIWSAHCHNDFGLATQNSLNAVFDGPARQVEGCINGIGERAGNVALEQVVMAIRHFGALANPSFPYFTNVHTEHFGEICEFVSRHMLPVQPHWPVSGRNAMRHSAGGHTNAILKNPLIYQPFDPKEVGKEISLVFGPLSGGNHSQSIVRSFGYDVKDDEKHEIAQYIKDRYQDRRKGVTDEEVLSAYIEYRSPIHIDEIDYSRSKSRSFVLLKGRFFEIEGEMTETHEGQDSALAALKKAIDVRFPGLEIQSHKSSSDGEGIAALSISKIILTDSGGDLFEGTGEDRDIEISAMKALISAVNRAFVDSRFRIPE